MHGHLSLERILGPDPIPEFRYCSRCDIELKQGRVEDICTDCDGLYAHRAGPSHGRGFPPVDPAYEVSLHYRKHPINCPTVRTLDALKIPYTIYSAKHDEIEVAYAISYFKDRHINPEVSPTVPIVLITSHGTVVDFWDGFDLARLNQIPAAREAAINKAHGSQSGVPNREQIAA